MPDRVLTPGATNPAVSQATIGETICRHGWSRSARPPRNLARNLKRERLRGHPGRSGDFELDHLIPLSLGGAPIDQRNLWLEPRRPADGWGSRLKDRLEARLHRLVCSGRLGLAEAQSAIAGDWRAAYLRFLGGPRRPEH